VFQVEQLFASGHPAIEQQLFIPEAPGSRAPKVDAPPQCPGQLPLGGDA
jgi:hypothetical protein